MSAVNVELEDIMFTANEWKILTKLRDFMKSYYSITMMLQEIDVISSS